jgi:hypothetical protein
MIMTGQCSGHSKLMTHLTHSAGIGARPQYRWGGEWNRVWAFYYSGGAGSLRFLAPVNDFAPLNPHFTFHAITDVAGGLYDPSYGTTGWPPWDEICPPFSVDGQGTFDIPPVPGDPIQVTPAVQTRSALPAELFVVSWTCGH